MATQIGLPIFTQPSNDLTSIADGERLKLYPINDYSPKSGQYGPQHPDALADGDELGRGTASFLDYSNTKAGTSTDIFERNNDLKLNEYDRNNRYPNF